MILESSQQYHWQNNMLVKITYLKYANSDDTKCIVFTIYSRFHNCYLRMTEWSLLLANSLLLSYTGENRYPTIPMRSTLHTISTSNFEVLQHANIAGYDLAYNKLRKMRKTITSQDGTTQTVDFTVLTLVYKMRN